MPQERVGNVTWRRTIDPYTTGAAGIFCCPDASRRAFDPNNDYSRRGDADAGTNYDGYPISHYVNAIPSFGSGYGSFSTSTAPTTLAQLQTPVGTIAFLEGEFCIFPSIDISSTVGGSGCTALGVPTQSGAVGRCLWAGRNGRSVYMFCDGHAQVLTPEQTISGDRNMWIEEDAVPTTGYWSGGSTATIASNRAYVAAEYN